jgi:thiol-disulfide isomerase/thioredoxin
VRNLAVAVVVAFAAVACSAQPSAAPTAVPSGPTGAIREGSVAKFRSTLRSMRGKPVVVNYWATWCEPCKAETPRLVRAAHEYEGRVRFLGVDVQDDSVAARRFVRVFRVPYPSLTDPMRKILRSQKRIVGLPVTQFYEADGKLAFVHFGEIKADDLEEKIRELLRAGD